MSMNFGIAEYWYDLYDFLLENTLQLYFANKLFVYNAYLTADNCFVYCKLN